MKKSACQRIRAHYPRHRVKDFLEQSGETDPLVIVSEKGRSLKESLCNESTVYIFGTGHIARNLASLTRLVGFRTVFLGDRKEVADRRQFGTADEVIVSESCEQAMNGLNIDRDSYLLLVTHGHAHDKTALAQALKTDACYIGMIWNRRERGALYHALEIYRALEREGFPTHELKRLHSPIGLAIGAETPEETAVSIVAELVRARAERKRRKGSEAAQP